MFNHKSISKDDPRILNPTFNLISDEDELFISTAVNNLLETSENNNVNETSSMEPVINLIDQTNEIISLVKFELFFPAIFSRVNSRLKLR